MTGTCRHTPCLRSPHVGVADGWPGKPSWDIGHLPAQRMDLGHQPHLQTSTVPRSAREIGGRFTDWETLPRISGDLDPGTGQGEVSSVR